MANPGGGTVRVDVLVLGLGTAGAAVAAMCARRGLRVLGVDLRAEGHTGARWHNGVSREAFDRNHLARPSGAEGSDHDLPMHLVAGWGEDPAARVRVTRHGVLEVDMRALTRRLLRIAEDHGARCVHGATVEVAADGSFHGAAGAGRAEVVVDGTGLGGAGIVQVPKVPRDFLCVASQSTWQLSDRTAAASWFAARGVPEGEVLCYTGVAGGYSIVNVRFQEDHFAILAGAISPAGSGAALVRRFVREHPFIGRQLSGGGRAIPLRRPFSRLDHGRVLLVGDAGCQVHAAHGSGIAAQLDTATLIADGLASGQSLWQINAAFQRGHGGRLAGADLFRRFSSTLSTQQLSALLADGVLSEALVRDGMAQRSPRLGPAELAQVARGLSRQPDVARRMGGVIARLPAVEALYQAYPSEPRGLARWRGALAALAGPAPEVDRV
jgi:flavin-dependent dehydrogenase